MKVLELLKRDKVIITSIQNIKSLLGRWFGDNKEAKLDKKEVTC